MTPNHERVRLADIRERAADVPRPAGYWQMADDRGALLAALDAVLALHKPGEGSSQGWTDNGYGWVEPYCAGCEANEEYAVTWPCPTVRAVESVIDLGDD